METNLAATKRTIDIPGPLKEAVQSGRVVLFLGAGASMEAKNTEGSKPPSGEQLGSLLAKQFLGEDLPGIDLMQISEMAAGAAGGDVVNDYIGRHLKTFSPSPAHKLLPTFRWHTLATTNYDTLVEDAYGSSKSAMQDLLPFVKNAEPIETRIADVAHPLVYLKLHGCVDHAHDKDIPLVLDSSHFERYRANRERLFDRLEGVAHELPFLFVGYKIGDPHIANMIHRLDRMSARPEYYIVTPNVPESVRAHWASRRIKVIEAKFGPFMKALDQEIAPMWRKIVPGSLKPDLPLRKHFETTSDPSQILVRSLEKDLLHVHPSMPTDDQKPVDFYRGYDRGFGGVALNLDAQRAVANDIIYELIDQQSAEGPRFLLLRGAGGTGKTVSLKRIAWDVAKDFGAPVLWLRENGRLRVDAISDLSNMIRKRIYIIVDEAAGYIDDLTAVLREAKAQNLPISFIAAERDTAWNTASDDFDERWKTQPFPIGQLSEREIEDLIDRLKRHSALGVLSALTPKEQVRAFESANRHLLVALHEVTQGKPFEEIVIDECRSLTPAKAQQLYLDVCTLNQFGASVRAGVINRISAIPFSVYKDSFFEPLEGVVITQQNRYTGDFEYRARHPRVASLVFRQAFGEDADRVAQLTRVITSLDEGYAVDREAIGQLIKARNLVNLLTDINWGREIYERALKHLGEQWYVWHQRAVYELQHADGSLEDADIYSETALKLEPGRGSVQHTYAEVARIRAQKAAPGTRKDVYRRQARERLGGIGRKSSYAESSRCKLLLDELSDALAALIPDDDVSAESFADATRAARSAISEAVLKYPGQPEILSLQSDFYRLIDDDRRARVVLERAWALSPRNPSAALQLARIYRSEGDSAKVQGILDEALDRHDTDQSVNRAMAQHIIRSGEDIARAAYFLGRSYGSSDRNYAARYLHAQYQLLVGKGDEAAALFDEVDQIAPSDYMPSSEFKRSDIGKLIGNIDGRIVKVEETYAFISSAKYPRNIYAHIANSDSVVWRDLRLQSRVTFDVGFNRRGPVALNVGIGA